MTEYCPGAVQVPQVGGVTLDTSLPPRAVWHITWDALNASGGQPDFEAVAGYLQREGYCPHLMWNPFTGYSEQYYPASQGSRALMYNDGDGAACVQIEVFFTPGCVVNGVKYETVADTPLVGFDTILTWLDSLGVPRVWPMGSPQWQGNPRDVGIWNGNAGHYGHCNSPGDTHTDPGPMPDLSRGAINPQSIPTQETDMPITDDDAIKIANTLLRFQVDKDGGGKAMLLEVIASNSAIHDALVTKIVNGVLDAPIKNVKTGGTTTIRTETGWTAANFGNIPGNVWNAPITGAANAAGVLANIDAKPAGTTVTNAAPVDVEALAAALAPKLNAGQADALIAALRTQINK